MTFATYLNLPNTPEAFRDMIARFKTKKIDAGYVDDHCFANVLSGGMFSDIGFLVTKGKEEIWSSCLLYQWIEDVT